MTCLGPEQLAMLATGSVDDDAAAHAVACLSCRMLLDEQRTQHRQLAALPVPALGPARREAIAAEIMARMDHLDGEHATAMHAGSRTRVVAMGGGLAAAAAAALLVIAWSGGDAERPAARPAPREVAALAPERSSGAHDPGPRPGDLAPRPSEPAVKPGEVAIAVSPPLAREAASALPAAYVVGEGEYAVKARGDRDVLTLRAGTITIDAIAARPVRVVVGDTTIAVRDAKVEVGSRQGAITQVQVFAGSVQLSVRGERILVEAGETWEPPAPLTTGAAAFREAWTALRAERYDEAIAAFDRADESVVAEDALYWSAIACERAGRHAEAVRRFRQLVAQFPDSPRVVEANAAIARE